MYRGLTEAILRGETDATTTGKRIVLPANFVGGARYMIHNYQDAVATGKTYIWRALSAALRSTCDIVLAVASSGIASLLIPGGRTAHSRFANRTFG
ncbi:helicase-like protein [Trifolium medium]|uniref:ATP-dependent DNA helicase n=1 Tax=Trifolium medium TaxID=97028 RepID=A0A392MBY6_9FABA|nr:helicase-like protein [Trifolium medium]